MSLKFLKRQPQTNNEAVREDTNPSSKQSSTKRSKPKTSDHKTFIFDDLISGRVDTFVKSSYNSLKSDGKPQDMLSTGIRSIDDVDFVLVGLKHDAKSFVYKIGVQLSDGNRKCCQCCRPTPSSAPRAELYEFRAKVLRQAYLDKLRQEYGVEWRMIETDEHYFYIINLSFAHLGLMTQLMSYQWRLEPPPQSATEPKAYDESSSLPPIDPVKQQTQNVQAYKSFFFMKRPRHQADGSADGSAKVDFRFNEYHGCKDHSSYPSQLRHDLAYHFLIGARVTVEMPKTGLSPWQDVFLCGAGPESRQKTDPPSKSRSVNLTDVIERGVFDDWLCLHQQIPEPVEAHQTRDIEHGNACCATCCFPCMTCQCSAHNTSNSNNNANNEGFCNKLTYLWRSFWYTNAIDCYDLDQRPNENDRQYLSRVSTIRNAFRAKLFNCDDDGDGVIDTDKDRAASNEQHSALYVMYHLLPLEKLRQYFGEKIGFYFCWIELMILSMVFPAVLGVLMFIAGLIFYSIEVHRSLADSDNVTDNTETPGYVLAKACDNYATIGYAAVMIIWGAAFGEMWKRRNVWYKFLWRVSHLENSELRRVNVYAFRCVDYMVNHSSWTHAVMYIPSLAVTGFFIALVWASIYLINMLDVRLSMEHCHFPPPPDFSSKATTTTTTEASLFGDDGFDVDRLVSKATSWFLCNILCVVLHSLSIAILDNLYTRVCYPLTHLEGHSTQSSFNSSLILKLFAFRFVNNYSILFYIAFVVAPNYGDTVVVYAEALTGISTNNTAQVSQAKNRTCKQLPCMTLISKQLLGIIVTSPLIHSFKDRLLPMVFGLLKSCRKPKSSPRVSDLPPISQTNVRLQESDRIIAAELTKQFDDLHELSTLSWREFTIEEFIEKTIVFGALQMFAVALPPAPALAMIIMRIDLNFDIARMVESFRRPVPVKSTGIGVWADVVDFLTLCGIITNPLIVVLTSSWGSELTIWWKFWVFLIFEHVVFIVRSLVAACVPDEPQQLRNLRLRQKFAKSLISG